MAEFEKIKHERERCFAHSFFDHGEWVYEPGPFYVDVGGERRRFTPDFWDKKRDIFIEVVGSRQAFNKNKEKYRAFASKYPSNFEIRTFDAHKKIDPFSNKACFADGFAGRKVYKLQRGDTYTREYDLNIFYDDLFYILSKTSCTFCELGEAIGVQPEFLSRIFNGLNTFAPFYVWQLIENFIFCWRKDPYRFDIKSTKNNKATLRIISDSILMPFYNS
jgi:hypothetical protein